VLSTTDSQNYNINRIMKSLFGGRGELPAYCSTEWIVHVYASLLLITKFQELKLEIS
jgi:hypothetical protein